MFGDFWGVLKTKFFSKNWRGYFQGGGATLEKLGYFFLPVSGHTGCGTLSNLIFDLNLCFVGKYLLVSKRGYKIPASCTKVGSAS